MVISETYHKAQKESYASRSVDILFLLYFVFALKMSVLSAAYYSRVAMSITFGYSIQLIGQTWLFLTVKLFRHSTIMSLPGAVARSEVSSLDMQAAPSSIPTSGTFFRGNLVRKTFLRPFSLFRWFKKSSCQLLAKECALSTGKLPSRLAQEQCG